MKKRPVLSTISISAGLAVVALSATAQEGCFARTYDAAHLAAHPDQVIERLSLHFTADGSRPGTSFVDVTAQMAMQGHALRRGAGGMRLEEFALCSADGACTIACDGGGFRIAGFDGTTLEIETRDARVAAQSCTPGSVVSTLAEIPGEISTYRLTQAPDEACGR